MSPTQVAGEASPQTLMLRTVPGPFIITSAITNLLWFILLQNACYVYLPVDAFPEGNPGHWCSRFPGGHEADTSRGDNGYYIEVKDAVTQMIVSEFIPSQKYEGESKTRQKLNVNLFDRKF